MSPKLEYLYLSNFKSFRGTVLVGPIKGVSVIIGENGSGKSNILDGLCFVMGGNAKYMRVKRLNDLIHGVVGGKPVAHSAQVTAVFALNEKSNRNFTRTVRNNACEYRVNGQVVAKQEYIAELKELGILGNAKNCLIMQDMIDNIMRQSAEELTDFLEEVSGSLVYKSTYESLNREAIDLEKRMSYITSLRKSYLASRKSSLNERAQAERYTKLQKQLYQLKLCSILFELYHIKREMEILKKIEEEEATEIEKLEKNRDDKVMKQKESKKQAGVLSRRLEAIESDLRQLENTYRDKEIILNNMKELVAHSQLRMKHANLLLAESIAARATHQRTIQELKEELATVQQLKTDFEEGIAAELSSQGSTVELSNTQVQEYSQLKGQAQRASYALQQDCDRIKEEQNADECILENEQRKKEDLEHKLRCKQIIKDETEKRIRNGEKFVEDTKDDLERLLREKQNLNEKLKSLKENKNKITEELKEISEQLKDTSYDNHVVSELKKKAETIRSLKALFAGVYGRAFDLCRPIHSRYNIAIAKVFGQNMDAIIVDSTSSAKACITYLRQQKIGVETFLPLDNLKVRPLKERLRNIRTVKDVKLLYDVIQISVKDIDHAILFITRNTLVCETVDDALKLINSFDEKDKTDCVALDGTLYRKDGTFSGGQASLMRKAKYWAEKDTANLKLRKENLEKQLLESLKVSEVEHLMNSVGTEIQGLMIRLKHAKHSLEECKNTIAIVENEMRYIADELNVVSNSMASINNRIKERNQSIRDIEKAINNIEDEVFANFCQRASLTNIRQYEERDLFWHQKQEKRRMEFDEHCNRIKNILSYEMHRDTMSAIEKNKKLIESIEENLKVALEEEAMAKRLLDEQKLILGKTSDECDAIKAKYFESEQLKAKYKGEVKLASESLRSAEKMHVLTLASLAEMKSKARSLFTDSKVNNIDIPLLSENTVSSAGHMSLSLSVSSIESRDVDDLLYIDFTKLSKEMQTGNVSANRDRLSAKLTELEDELKMIEKPDMKAGDKLESTLQKLKDIKNEADKVRLMYIEKKRAFEKIKQKRLAAFNESFEWILQKLDATYKRLYKNKSASAMIVPENPSEPYLGGTHFSCTAPGKRLQPLYTLSGGEKTLASLALLFALNSCIRPPFFAFDEVDAALDKTSERNLIELIHAEKEHAIFLCISFKEIANNADAVFGVAIEPDADTVQSLLYSVDVSSLPVSREDHPRESSPKEQTE